jgi:hypothetical protein
MLKLVHDYLPTRHPMSKFQGWTPPPTCYYCNEIETFDHFQCSAECNVVSQSFHSDLATAIKNYFVRNHAPADFQDIILHAIQRWLKPGQTPTAPIPETESMLQSQKKIEWRFITRGILSKQWREELYVSSLARNDWSTMTVDDPALVDPDDLLDLETISLHQF